MNVKTIDLKEEARRIAKIFDADCADGLLEGHPFATVEWNQDGLKYTFLYSEHIRRFYVAKAIEDEELEDDTEDEYTEEDDCTEIALDWAGIVRVAPSSFEYAGQLARVLFHLDLLTPEVEEKLQVSISAHQKTKWLLEHETASKYRLMNWESEAKRVAKAFGIARECTFNSDKRTLSMMLKVSKGIFKKDPKLENGVEVAAMYCDEYRYFALSRGKGRNRECAFICLAWDGSIDTSVAEPVGDTPLSEDLAKALFFLNLLTPEVASALEVTITPHKTGEWTLERG